MNQNLFLPQNFFDLTDFPFKDIFNGVNNVNNVWEVIPKIKEYSKEKLLMGEGSVVAEGALIREGVILGKNVYIGPRMELKNCIIMNNTLAKHMGYIADSIIGNDCNISGGTMFANFRLDHKPVTIKKEAQRIDTGLQKFSAVLGDGTWTGVNSVLNPGSILGKNCKIYPLVSVVGYYPADSLITSTK